MGKMIAVCGSPNSGTTTLSLKLAMNIYESNKGVKVIFVSPDVTIPTLGYVFPNAKGEHLYSLGVALNKTDVFKEDVVKQFVTTNTMRDFAVLGFKLGENKYSYPEPTEDKICQLFSSLKDLDKNCIVVVDCTSDESDLISTIAKRECDVAVQVINPTVKSTVYYGSCINQFLMIEGKKIQVINTVDNDIYLPFDEVKSKCSEGVITIPYSREIKQQMITGKLTEKLHDSKYMKAIGEISKAVMSCGTNG